MLKRYNRLLVVLHVIADMGSGMLALILAYWVRFHGPLTAFAPVTKGIPVESLLSPQEGFEGTKDPHVWGDSALWVKTIEPVVETLSKADPEGAAGQ